MYLQCIHLGHQNFGILLGQYQKNFCCDFKPYNLTMCSADCTHILYTPFWMRYIQDPTVLYSI